MPSGTDTVEFPRSRNGRRKNFSLETKVARFVVPFFSSWAGSCSFGDKGTILEALRIRSMKVVAAA